MDRPLASYLGARSTFQTEEKGKLEDSMIDWYSLYFSGVASTTRELCKCDARKEIIVGVAVNAPTPFFCLQCACFINPIHLFDLENARKFAKWFELHNALTNLSLQFECKNLSEISLEQKESTHSEYIQFSRRTLNESGNDNLFLWRIVKNKNRVCPDCRKTGRIVESGDMKYHLCSEHRNAY